jgi:hypothetical protein
MSPQSCSAVSAHSQKNAPELRDQIKSNLKDEADRSNLPQSSTVFLQVGALPVRFCIQFCK